MSHTFQKGNINACCKQDENLSEHQENPKLKYYKCKVCGRRHFVFKAELSDAIKIKEAKDGEAA